MQGMGIDPAKWPARDTLALDAALMVAERALLSRWARGPMQGMGIDPAKWPARDMRALDAALMVAERARASRWARRTQ